MKSHWKFWFDSKNEKNADNLLSKVEKLLPLAISKKEIESYHKGGYVVSFCLTHATESWNDYVVEVISLGQGLGRGWSISGDITLQADGWSNESRISGIQSIQWSCDEQY